MVSPQAVLRVQTGEEAPAAPLMQLMPYPCWQDDEYRSVPHTMMWVGSGRGFYGLIREEYGLKVAVPSYLVGTYFFPIVMTLSWMVAVGNSIAALVRDRDGPLHCGDTCCRLVRDFSAL